MRDLIISCHPAKMGMLWKQRARTKSLRCPECGSVTPDEFVEAILGLKLVSGWHLNSDDEASYCVLSDNRVFRHEHLLDMPVDWMIENAPIIHASTGVLFYWTGERMRFRYIGVPKGKILKNGQIVSDKGMDQAFSYLQTAYGDK